MLAEGGFESVSEDEAVGCPARSNRESRMLEAGGRSGGTFIWEGSVLLETAAGAVADGGQGMMWCRLW